MGPRPVAGTSMSSRRTLSRVLISTVVILLVVFSIAAGIDLMTGGFTRMPSIVPPI
jgi:hypothetical protein